MSERVLVVDDEEGIRSFIAEVLEGMNLKVNTAANGREASKRLDRESFHLMITDLRMPEMDGMALLAHSRKVAPEMEVIVLTAHGTVETAVEAMKSGAFDYLNKPLSGPDELRLVVARALERRRLKDGHRHSTQTSPASKMVAVDPLMREVADKLAKVAATNTTVLLLGESGTGKEVAARTIHELSARREAPFVAMNCAAVSEQLIESELFGHEKGSFTGAAEQRRGRFELADNGTLFLDEVGELSPALQAKLLRVLEEQRFERLGGSRVIEVDVRVLAATNRNLADEVAAGRFRSDLYHRIAVFPLLLPPLRERPGDILPISEHLLTLIADELKRPGLKLTKEAEQEILTHSWPGNVRELKNTLERAAILEDSREIKSVDLAPQVGAQATDPVWDGTLRDIEKEAIKQALKAVGGRRKQAAAKLGIGLRTLYEKIKEYNLTP